MNKFKACLTIQKGGEQGRQYVIRAGQEFVIGRSLGCTISLGDGLISRRHCVLQLDARGLRVTDLGSRNGTLLDGKRLEANQGTYTCAKDVLQVGGHIFSVEVSGLSADNQEALQRTRRFAKNFVPLDEFEILGEIGRGATGVVYGAHQKNLRRNVAIKIPRTDVPDYSDTYTRFVREGQLCSKIANPHVVTIHDMRMSGKRIFIVMELVNGGSVSDRLGSAQLTGKPMEIAEIAKIGEHVALALHAIHLHKVIHRDLKPSNILLSPEGHAKLADFGIAKYVGEQTNEFAPMTGTDEGIGTLGYIPPEAATVSESIGTYSDIYSLGATLYHMLTNKVLFLSDDLERTLHRIVNEKPIPVRKLRPDCPAPLAAMIDAMLAKSPIDRPRDALDIAVHLNKIASKLQNPQQRILQQTDMYHMREMPNLHESHETDIFF